MKSIQGPAIFLARFMGDKPRLEESLPVLTGELAAPVFVLDQHPIAWVPYRAVCARI